jgi:hypothetical protein
VISPRQVRHATTLRTPLSSSSNRDIMSHNVLLGSLSIACDYEHDVSFILAQVVTIALVSGQVIRVSRKHQRDRTASNSCRPVCASCFSPCLRASALAGAATSASPFAVPLPNRSGDISTVRPIVLGLSLPTPWCPTG